MHLCINLLLAAQSTDRLVAKDWFRKHNWCKQDICFVLFFCNSQKKVLGEHITKIQEKERKPAPVSTADSQDRSLIPDS